MRVIARTVLVLVRFRSDEVLLPLSARWEPPKGVKYLFKRVRFGKVEGDPRRSKVFTITNPVGASKPPSYLQRWDGEITTQHLGGGDRLLRYTNHNQ